MREVVFVGNGRTLGNDVQQKDEAVVEKMGNFSGESRPLVDGSHLFFLTLSPAVIDPTSECGCELELASHIQIVGVVATIFTSGAFIGIPPESGAIHRLIGTLGFAPAAKMSF